MTDLLFHNITPISVANMKPSQRLRLAARVAENIGFSDVVMNKAVFDYLEKNLPDLIKNNEDKVALDFKENLDTPQQLAHKYGLTCDQVYDILRRRIGV